MIVIIRRHDGLYYHSPGRWTNKVNASTFPAVKAAKRAVDHPQNYRFFTVSCETCLYRSNGHCYKKHEKVPPDFHCEEHKKKR